jgi:hypothetical protein
MGQLVAAAAAAAAVLYCQPVQAPSDLNHAIVFSITDRNNAARCIHSHLLVMGSAWKLQGLQDSQQTAVTTTKDMSSALAQAE